LKASGKWALDSNAYIDAVGGSPVLETIDQADAIYLPAIVVGEILFGALNSGRPADNLRTATQFINNCAILPVDAAVAMQYARLRLTLKQAGKPLPENDLWIAATCIVHDVPLLTRDEHFRAIPELRQQDWPGE
jgi:tRNA(fMet)-specific endonuclease VapC